MHSHEYSIHSALIVIVILISDSQPATAGSTTKEMENNNIYGKVFHIETLPYVLRSA